MFIIIFGFLLNKLDVKNLTYRLYKKTIYYKSLDIKKIKFYAFNLEHFTKKK